MRGIGRVFIQELRHFLREPVMAFFGLAFPPLIMLLFGFIMGNEPNPLYGGLGSVDISVPAYAAMVIGVAAFMSLPITIAGYRERGVLRRYRSTPLSPIVVLGVQLAIQYLVTLLGVILMAVLGKALFDMKFSGSATAVLAGLSFSCLSFLSIGMVLAAVAPSTRASVVLGNLLLYPMIYLSGATIPLEVLPKAARSLSGFIPMTQVVTLMRGLWTGDSLLSHGSEFLVLGGVMAASAALAALLFRWD